MSKDIIKDNMSDYEIRVLGSDNELTPKSEGDGSGKSGFFRKTTLWISLAVALLLAVIVGILLFQRHNGSLLGETQDSGGMSDTLSTETLQDSISSGPAYVVTSDTIINDIPLRTLTPIGGHIELYVGHNPENDKNIILAAHAADLRDDDGTPAGAFVYNGELFSKGHSKYGFCAIVDGEVSIGRQIETPLFERAIEQNGSFFRQYSLITNGKLMSIPQKGKAVRRALCLKDSTLILIESMTPESYHDFSLALEDYGISEALALVGANAAVMWRDNNGKLTKNGEKFGQSYQYENYIIWRKRH